MNALNITISAKLYSKNPDETELGKRILSKSIALMDELGYENLTFKKVAREIKVLKNWKQKVIKVSEIKAKEHLHLSGREFTAAEIKSLKA